ncbi:hypothetical protein FRIG_08175 [Frigoribacterium faeni]|uniref:hypothetical protein n=1 Tax=Frigoribacterium faeni TaxID=145483 RepID=UPI001FACB66D|nr:hypothetical protein [Frigoribacterium faeni]MCJ0701109.1 hypothetical protein [Frigoribacterium faeni]
MGARGTWLVVGVVATVVAAVVSLGEVGGSSARLSDSASTSDGPVVVTSGSASLTLDALALPADPLYPGLTLRGPVTATNTGTVGLSLGVAAATVTSVHADTAPVPALLLGLGTATSATDGRAGRAASVWSGTATDRPAAASAPTSVVLAAGESRTLCVSVAMGDDGRSTSQGLGDLALALRLTGTQV